MDDGGSKKKHKKRQSGAKVKKKAKKGQKLDAAKHNPRAFTFSGGIRSVQKSVQRSLDKEAKKLKQEVIDKTPEVHPPVTVVVQGPSGVGKTTLIRSLVKHYTKHNLSAVRGPITLASGVNRRLTFVECPNDMSQMIDLAKIADLVLLLIDASFGFEMETFEFLNVMQVHGFPRVLGVLTHLDSFKENKTLRKTKKKLKNRFWAEIYDGAKLFYLSGLQHGRYNRTEIRNLSRFIAVQKFQPLSWRSAHPYLLSLRHEDHTDPTEPVDAPRSVRLYGYLRGARMREGQQVHIPGAGDFSVEEIKTLTDPCPPPVAELSDDKRKKKSAAASSGSRMMRSLKERHRNVYAPAADVGNVLFDADAMYIHLPDHKIGFTKKTLLEKDKEKGRKRKGGELDEEEADGEEEEEGELPEAVRMIRRLQEADSALDRRVGVGGGGLQGGLDGGVPLLAGSRRLVKEEGGGAEEAMEDEEDSSEEEEDEDGEEEEEEDEGDEHEDDEEEEEGEEDDEEDSVVEDSSGRIRRRAPVRQVGKKTRRGFKEETEESLIAMEKQQMMKKMAEGLDGSDEEEEDEDEDEREEAEEEGWTLEGQEDEEEEGGNAEASALRFSRPLSLSSLVYGDSRWDPRFLSAVPSFSLFVSASMNRGGGGTRGGASPFPLGGEGGSRKLDLFEDEGEEDEDEEGGRLQPAAPGGKGKGASAGAMGEVPQWMSALRDGEESSKIPPLLLLSEEERAQASFSGEGIAGALWTLSCRWTTDAKTELRAQRFITGGWDGDGPSSSSAAAEKTKGKEEEEANGKMGEEGAEGKEVTEGAGEEEDNLKIRKAREEELKAKQEESLQIGAKTGAGAQIGAFVRVTVSGVSPKWAAGLTPERPVVVGGLLPGESSMGMMQVKIKKHRWAPRILKTNDPLMFSMGWRRFQALPLFCLEDRNQKRMRMLKYTPEHMHCTGTVWGPVCPPNTGILAVRNWGKVPHFRISATGSCVEMGANFRVVKKLKLIGEPKKIFKHTAFVKGMFSSEMEVAKCIGAKIQTVSGIRGQIKKASGSDGTFRATFEDKILMSDIVICKAWVKVEAKKFFNPVVDVADWRRLRTITELRADARVPVPFKRDSSYRGGQQERMPRKFNELRVPENIAKNLPFSAKEKAVKKAPKSRGEVGRLTKEMKSEYETRVESLLKRLGKIRNARDEQKQEQLKKRRADKAKQEAKETEKREGKQKDIRKKRYVKKGKVETAMRKKMRLGGGEDD